jgi:hypothetical protein
VIVSSLNLLSNLRRDALAEKLLTNLVSYAKQIMPAELATEQPDDAETLRFEQTSYNDCMTKFVRRTTLAP